MKVSCTLAKAKLPNKKRNMNSNAVACACMFALPTTGCAHNYTLLFLPRTLGEWLMQSMAVQFCVLYVDWRLSLQLKGIVFTSFIYIMVLPVYSTTQLSHVTDGFKSKFTDHKSL